MKKVIFTITLLCSIISVSIAQEKGDNFLGLDFGSSKTTYEFLNANNEAKNNYFGVNYSKFLKNNKRFNIALFYSNSKTEYDAGGTLSTTKTNGYGFNLGYGFLFPLLKNFYAEASPGINYSFTKIKNDPVNSNTKNQSNSYGANLAGGLLWVPFKHFGVSSRLASVGFSYYKQKQESINNSGTATQTSSSFSLSNSGNLYGQSFTIFYKFK